MEGIGNNTYEGLFADQTNETNSFQKVSLFYTTL